MLVLRAGRSSVDVDELIGHIEMCILREYDDAGAAGVGYSSSEGGYLLPTRHTLELLSDLGFYAGNDGLHDLIVDGLPPNAWVKQDPYGLSDSDELLYGWEEFARLVKHRVRYLLFPPKEEKGHPFQVDGVAPEDMLDTLGALVRDLELVTLMPEGTWLFRVLIHPVNESPNTLAELGPPPIEKAVFANRMSPSGISMYYAALERETAVAETFFDDRRPVARTLASFRTDRPIQVLDLTSLPDIPDFFSDSDDYSPWLRHRLLFLHGFAESLVQPVPKERTEHIEYVPSQVVTEFFRHKFRGSDGEPIDGILYSSSRRVEGRAVVLFFSHDDVAETWEFGPPAKPPVVLIEEDVEREVLE